MKPYWQPLDTWLPGQYAVYVTQPGDLTIPGTYNVQLYADPAPPVYLGQAQFQVDPA